MSTDEMLLAAVANGNASAFETFYTLYSSKVYNTALSYTKNIEDAEEITQDVFLKIHKNASAFKGKASVSTWVYRITVNTALNAINKKKRFAFLHFGDAALSESFEHPGIKEVHKEEGKMLYALIENLPNKQKTAFILSFIEELPRKQVAEIMNNTLKGVEGLLQRAKKQLNNALKKHYPNRGR